jgi:hypothetical protein
MKKTELQTVFDPWYATEEAKHVLQVTDDGMFLFVWRAVLRSGLEVNQFQPIELSRALSDEQYVPPGELRISSSELPKEEVESFSLYPIAVTRKYCPWFQKPIVVKLDLEAGDRFISHWLVTHTLGYHTAAGVMDFRLRRHVVGIERDGVYFSTVISPSGLITIVTDENQSYEGE